MDTPVFEEIDPGRDCECPGCVHRRRVVRHSTRCAHLAHPVARQAIVVATAAGAALGAGYAAPAVAAVRAPVDPGGVPAGEEPETPQGKRAPLYGPAGRSTDRGKPSEKIRTPPITRAEIIERAMTWVDAEVPYSMTEYWYDGYRQDCSGFVSMAWNLPMNEWTGSLDKFAQRISGEELLPGDMLLFHNPENPQKGSHVVIFGGWTDYTHTYYTAYESTRPYARRQVTPYPYWSNGSRYVPYRYTGLIEDDTDSPDGDTGPVGSSGTVGTPGTKGSADPAGSDRFPGAAYFGPGADNRYVTRLGQLLVERGGGRFYTDGPGPRWSEADRRATQAFQRAQGWTGRGADGLPGPLTWSYLVTGRGRDIPPAGNRGPTIEPAALRPSGASGDSPSGAFGSGPGPRWGESDRRNVEAFQRAQGRRGGAADGCPGPETWHRLFS
ncbi:peptidoglycan-binding protein [Streptomyces ipomoeae]|nr:peptidoglycan-binding protein [Streptomyces ipomoeae]